MTDPERTSVDRSEAARDGAPARRRDTEDPCDTARAPSLPPMLADHAADPWAPGRQVGDFLLVKVLGKGSFGTVYLARQLSLERDIALKVTATRAASHGEGLALAGLEHDHIVKVFAEFTDAKTGRHCLVLQYVPGADLACVIRTLHAGARPRSGETVLKAIDAHVRGESRFDPRALRDREELARDDFAQAVCRFGSQLAGALAYAHARGVLHCDVKPANVLVTPYGRPLLADFNVSFDRARRQPGDSGLGGTVAYMAPEHKAAVFGQEDGPPVDERSDVFSLGVVLHEIVTGRLPRPSEPESLDGVPRELAAVVRRCLEPDQAKRYQTATELADALRAAWALIGTRRSLPPPGRIGRWVQRHPYWALTLFAFAPHLVGSVLNIGYNAVEINSKLSDAQNDLFETITLTFNLLVYPGVVAVWWRLFRRVRQGFANLDHLSGADVDALRRHVLRLGYWAVGMACLGWLPGGVLFPLAIDHLGSEPVPWQVYAHYMVSFTLSGLVGIVFSYLGVHYGVMRALYPRLGNPDRHTPQLAREELRGPASWFVPFLTLASVVPLAGAVLLVVFADSAMSLGFRLLVVGLIGIGMAGVSLAARVTSKLNTLVAAWNGPSREEQVLGR